MAVERASGSEKLSAGIDGALPSAVGGGIIGALGGILVGAAGGLLTSLANPLVIIGLVGMVLGAGAETGTWAAIGGAGKYLAGITAAIHTGAGALAGVGIGAGLGAGVFGLRGALKGASQVDQNERDFELQKTSYKTLRENAIVEVSAETGKQGAFNGYVTGRQEGRVEGYKAGFENGAQHVVQQILTTHQQQQGGFVKRCCTGKKGEEVTHAQAVIDGKGAAVVQGPGA